MDNGQPIYLNKRTSSDISNHNNKEDYIDSNHVLKSLPKQNTLLERIGEHYSADYSKDLPPPFPPPAPPVNGNDYENDNESLAHSNLSISSSLTSFEGLNQIKYMDESGSNSSSASTPGADEDRSLASPTTAATLTPTTLSPHLVHIVKHDTSPFNFDSSQDEFMFTDSVCSLAKSEDENLHDDHSLSITKTGDLKQSSSKQACQNHVPSLANSVTCPDNNGYLTLSDDKRSFLHLQTPNSESYLLGELHIEEKLSPGPSGDFLLPKFSGLTSSNSPEPPCSPNNDDTEEVCSDTESLAESIYHQPPKAADRGAAYRLAKRLFNLEGFKITDVAKHLYKRNDFSQLVGEEYAGFFDFINQSLDAALRSFLSKFTLTGETQERERILHHFSRKYLQCNPQAYNSEDACHTLVCALMLLNTDLHGQNVSRKMSCQDFIANLAELNNGENFDREELKLLYNSIKQEPIHWPHDDQLAGIVNMNKPPINEATKRLLGATINPFLDIPSENNTKEYMRGFVLRKWVMESYGKKTSIGKRGWKMFYARLRDMVLYLHKDAESAAAASRAEDAAAAAAMQQQAAAAAPYLRPAVPPASPAASPQPVPVDNSSVTYPGSPAPELHKPKTVILPGGMATLPEQNQKQSVSDSTLNGSSSIKAAVKDDTVVDNSDTFPENPSEIPLGSLNKGVTNEGIINPVLEGGGGGSGSERLIETMSNTSTSSLAPQLSSSNAEAIIRIAHSYSYRATDYTKKQNVFRLKTKDGAEFLFQTSDPKEVEHWVDNLNFVAALLSAPPMASGVGSEKSFYRPLLPSGYTSYNIKEQLEEHQKRFLEFDRELKEHLKSPPKKGSRSKVKQEFEEKKNYLEDEIKRYKLYARLLEAELVQMQNVFASHLLTLPPQQQQAVLLFNQQQQAAFFSQNANMYTNPALFLPPQMMPQLYASNYLVPTSPYTGVPFMGPPQQFYPQQQQQQGMIMPPAPHYHTNYPQGNNSISELGEDEQQLVNSPVSPTGASPAANGVQSPYSLVGGPSSPERHADLTAGFFHPRGEGDFYEIL